MAELKPCPFCGHSAALESVGADHFVMCDGCCAESARWQSPTGDAESAKRRAVESWNRRATDGQRDAARGVPEGWKLVPVEPTDEMRLAAWIAWKTHDGQLDSKMQAALREAIASAPTPPDGDAERDRRDAERYRHVRAHGMPKLCPAGFYYHDGVFYPTADAAIDAYVAASKGEKA